MMLIMVSIGAKAQVKVLFGENGDDKFKSDGEKIEVTYDGGTIVVTQKTVDANSVTVYLAVTPNNGYTMQEKNVIEAYAVIPADANTTRALTVSEKLTLECDNYKDDTSSRTYHATIDSNLALWVKSADFQKKEDPSKGNRATGPVVISESTDNPVVYLIQSYSNEAFYMRNNNRSNAVKLNTSNIVTANSEFYFLDGSIIDDTQYYYMVHKSTGKYVYLDDAASGKVAQYGAAPTSGNEDKYRFKLVENAQRPGSYNIIVKLGGNTLSLNKGTGNWNTADVVQGNPNNDLSCWNIIAKANYTKTQAPFDVSTMEGTKYYYKIRNNHDQNYYMVPGDIFVSALSETDNNVMAWYFVKATDIEDDYLDYYYIFHPKSGKYLRYRLGNDVEDSNNAVELADYKQSEQGRFLFIIVPGSKSNETHTSSSASSTYCIAPKNIMVRRVENTISLSTRSNNTYDGTVRAFKERNGNNYTHWDFISTDYYTACDPPIVTYDVSTNKVSMSHSGGATIYYTTDGSDPTVPATGSTQTYSNSFTPSDGVIIKAVAAMQADGSDKSETTVEYVFKTVSSTTEMTSLNGAYRLATDFTSSATIGTADAPFKGAIDGNYNPISLGHALIGVAEDATIKNIIVSSATFSGSGNVGTIINTAKGTTKIYNCGVLGGSISGGTNVGGLVGLIQENSKVRVVNCYNYANVSGSSYAAGIVGKNEGDVGDVRIALCMMYGNVTGATNISPVYGGSHAPNVNNFTEYNYWLYSTTGANGKKVLKDLTYTAYNDQLAIEKEEYLTRFPFYRHILNTHRELASYFLFGDYEKGHVEEIGHWTVDKSKGVYPIVEEWKTNTHRTTVDIKANLPNTTEARKGKLLNNIGNDGYYTGDGTKITAMGSSGYLTVNVTINGTDCGSVDLPITDMNEDNYDYTWGKVVLPFANEFTGWTRDWSKVCTGWEITDVGGQSTFSIPDDEPYNFYDRNNNQKDIYDADKNPYIFAQGGYYIVPYGVSSIDINAHFAKAFYLSDASYDIGYNTSYGSPNPLGGSVTFKDDDDNDDSKYHGQTVYTDLAELESHLDATTNPHAQAIVLVGNYHFNLNTLTGVFNANDGAYTTPLNLDKAVTIMSTDEDNNQEPDYGWYTCNTIGRLNVPPIRFDFLPNIEMGMSSRIGSGAYPGIGIWHTRGWFEQTETCVSNMSQCEINSSKFPNSDDGAGNNRWIANSGYFVQIVRARTNPCINLSYIQIGGNAYVKELYPGCHSDNARINTAVPILVTGGQVDECYMTGYTAGGKLNGDIRFWCAGGKIKKFLGAYLEDPTAITGTTAGMTAKVDHALIGRFFGGGTSVSARIKGNIDITINNSQVDFYCGGPEFGDIGVANSQGVITNYGTVTTHATGTTFGEYYGAGFGGTSITYNKENDEKQYEFPLDVSPFPLDFTSNYKRLEKKTNYGIGTCYKFEYIYHSSGAKGVARFHTGYAQFSLATTGEVTNVLTNCIIKKLPGTNSLVTKETSGEFYGAGCQGKVSGAVTSTLTNCTIERNAFGGGYKAESNEVDVYLGGEGNGPTYSEYTKQTGIFSDFGEFPTPESFTWKPGTSDPNDTAKELYTGLSQVEMDELGNVTGNITLTINGSYVGGTAESVTPAQPATDTTDPIPAGGSVYGGGNESKSLSNTTVILKGNAYIYGDVFGGGNKAEVQGSSEVNIEE